MAMSVNFKKPRILSLVAHTTLLLAVLSCFTTWTNSPTSSVFTTPAQCGKPLAGALVLLLLVCISLYISRQMFPPFAVSDLRVRLTLCVTLGWSLYSCRFGFAFVFHPLCRNQAIPLTRITPCSTFLRPQHCGLERWVSRKS